ncbi:MAG: glycoside hydrolase family 13 protein [Rectinemataceae bacterium]
MIAAAVLHRATDSWCYPLDGARLHLRLATATGDVSEVVLRCGDPHEFERSATDPGTWTWKKADLALSRSGSDGNRDFWEIVWKPPYKRARYSFWLRSGGTWYEYGEKGLFPAEGPQGQAPGLPQGDYWNSFVFPYINEIDVYRAPDWVSGTVWYQIFPDRFRRGDPDKSPLGVKAWQGGPVRNEEFYGGDLAGILEKLEHLAGLGITGIYLTPIFAAPTVHKYDTEDYLRIDPAFGDDETLRRLVAACHARGIRLMLDAVFNHCGRTFGPWLDVVKNGKDSPYAPWFHIRSWPLFPLGRDTGNSRESGFESFSFTTRMPKFDTSNTELREFLLGVAERYIRDFDIDGWRLDVANEVDHEFWRQFRKRVKAIKSEAYIVGEIWHDAMPWLRGDQYDAVMNYPYGSAIQDFLLSRRQVPDGRAFEHRLDAIDFGYPLPVIRNNFNLLDSHDTERLVHKMGGDLALARLGWLLMFMLPGSPCIYYGSEVGLEGGGDPDNRRCMSWERVDSGGPQLDFMRALTGFRKRHAGLLNEGKRTFSHFEGGDGAFVLSIETDTEAIMTIVNRDDRILDGGTVAAALAALDPQSGEGPGKGPWRGATILLADPRERRLPAIEAPLLGRGFRVMLVTTK